MDWSAMEEEHTESSPQTSKLVVKMEEVTVATCGDDGLIRLWLPLQVGCKLVYSSIIFYTDI